MIVSEKDFSDLQGHLLVVANAIRDRDLSDLASLDEHLFAAMLKSGLMLAAHLFGPLSRDEDAVDVGIDWAVYGEEPGENADLFAAAALRRKSDQLLQKWGRDPKDPDFETFVNKGRLNNES